MGLRGWLHKFFYSDDPDVRLAGGLSEVDAGQYQELLANNGIMSMTKSMNSWAGRYGGAASLTSEHGLWVKQSDVEAAFQVLEHLLDRYETEDAHEVRQQLRRKRPGSG